MDIHFRNRLDRLLLIVEQSGDETLRAQIAWLIDILPPRVTAINKDILVLELPKIKGLLGAYKPLTKPRALEEYRELRHREDTIGQICDMMLQIIEAN